MAEAPGSAAPTEVHPTDALREAGQQLLSLLAQRAAQAATDRVNDLTGRLTGITENGGTGVMSALRGSAHTDDDDRQDSDDESGDDGEERPSGIRGMLGGLKDKVVGLFGGGGGGGGGGKGKKLKVTVISETQDIGLPLRTTYNLWTEYGDFPSFMKKVETVDQKDEKSNWKAQVFWSHREWQATTVEQVPDSHIVWKSTGAKGHVDGGVTFTELGPNLTRILLVMEYYPQGLFERTGNIWRAQGRRARLEFQHFRRHAMTDTILHPEDIEGWRGEIRDSEVVKTHEDAMEEEQRAAEEDEGAEGTEEDEGTAAASEQGDEDEGIADQQVGDEAREDEAPDEAAEHEGADEADEGPADQPLDDEEDEGLADETDETESADEYDGETDEYDEPADESDEDEAADETDEYDEPADESDEDEAADETDEYDDEATDDEDEATDEPADEAERREPDRGGRRRREPVGARSGRRR